MCRKRFSCYTGKKTDCPGGAARISQVPTRKLEDHQHLKSRQKTKELACQMKEKERSKLRTIVAKTENQE